jgi:hypothetical protein
MVSFVMYDIGFVMLKMQEWQTLLMSVSINTC